MAAKDAEAGKVGRLTKLRKEKEEKQRQLEFPIGGKEASKTEKKKVTITEMETRKRRGEEGEMESVEKIRSELDLEKKRFKEFMEEWKKKEQIWEIKIRILEEKMEEVEKEERRKNVVVKGIVEEKEIKVIKEEPKRWAKFFFKTKLGLDCNVEYGRVSNKNDLSWEERKIQEKIHRWAKEKREKGEEVKIGTRKVKIKGNWRQWRDIQREMEAGKRREKEDKELEDKEVREEEN
ncbi:histone-lysine N-methyltransferase, H3 lysine-79 specific-like [Pseudomyrmex gracilis]|uniref:histone-lysine N-methyltransferase, H3 lysine-79 specific-like n=1 Tax=Pseudomyrmex gracilis TaxID=219809 RepID=UPI000994E3D2|nr:histone-lysine N-methyltransferase, H3 lysine-79 specific-like [Pseudomyrmex gracilis]